MTESILEEAQRLIHGERNKNYGHPRDNFRDIAALFSAYLGTEITDIDVANLMILVKVARVHGTGYHRDSFADIAGYAGCVERIYEESEDQPVDLDKPRTWGSLLDIPEGVVVRDDGGWKWIKSEGGLLYTYGHDRPSEAATYQQVENTHKMYKVFTEVSS